MPPAVSEIPCDVCGLAWAHTAAEITIYSTHDETRITCSICQRLIDTGLIRPEHVDGVLRWRRWFPGEWTPGDLIPRPD